MCTVLLPPGVNPIAVNNNNNNNNNNNKDIVKRDNEKGTCMLMSQFQETGM
jgi:hypothetical protein